MLIDVNGKFDANQQLVLNKDAWVDAAPGTFGTTAPYYSNYRWRRQPSEAMSLGRSFPIKEKATFQVRIEFQNIFNRTFYSNPIPVVGGFGNNRAGANPAVPTTYYPDGTLSGGYGYVSTVGGGGAQPRTGQIVARFNF